MKPSTQFNTSINDMLVEKIESDNADPSDYSLAEVRHLVLIIKHVN